MRRRTFLKLTGAATITSTLAVGASIPPDEVRVTRHRLSWPGSDRFRIVQLSDLHVGLGTRDDVLAAGFEHARRAESDLVVLTGDYVNRNLARLPALEKHLGRLRHKTVATLGNHDHWSGAHEIRQCLQRMGIEVLSNQWTQLQLGAGKLTIVGVDDSWSQHADLDRAFKGLVSHEPRIVLTHAPDAFDPIARRGADLVLVGHTHGGQVQIPALTDKVMALAGVPYVSGWYHRGKSNLYVNAGIGSAVVRARIGRQATPEVAIFDLVPSGLETIGNPGGFAKEKV